MVQFAPSSLPRLAPARLLQAAGTVGSVMALAILAMSALLRLTTVFAADGHTLSTLPGAVEDTARLIHRLAASSVGLLALLATVLCWRNRRIVATAVVPVALLVVATLVLALIGPLTPGYRFTAVTVANVVGGTVLLASCWWLRERLAATPVHSHAPGPLLKAALIVFFIHVTTGATTSALEMRGIQGFAIVHQVSAMLVIVLLGAILWDKRLQERLPRLRAFVQWLLYAQIALGLTLMLAGSQSPWLALVHAMCSPLLIAGLVSIAVRDVHIEPGTGKLLSQ
jgi:heme A synthase